MIDLFALGTTPTNSIRNIEYVAIVRSRNNMIQQKEQKIRLMAYEGNQIKRTTIVTKNEIAYTLY